MTVTADAPAALTEDPERGSRGGVVERVIRILDAFTEAPGRLKLEQVGQITGLPRSTAFRLLGQLVDLQWIEHEGEGYSLGPRTALLSTQHSSYEEIRAAGSAALTELQLATRTVVHLSVLEGAVVRYLDKIGGAAAASVPSRVGARILAPDTVSGRAMLACLTPEQVDRALAGSYPAGASMDTLHRQLSDIRRRQGVAAMTAASSTSGISSLAVPVLGPRGLVAAVSVAARGELPASRIAPLVHRVARSISRNLYPDWAGAAPR
ncbi:IclR family transcriptional regulator [Rhodococcus sp. X156]|uniref:IclR family transcriptional regulator n=1 Tax=Rhodococcus sp. X156 TaxID=2499145 RepID=UPI000FDC9DAE|nr:IclR family transcriptional regulator [Rhodococcus sp. X156]